MTVDTDLGLADVTATLAADAEQHDREAIVPVRRGAGGPRRRAADRDRRPRSTAAGAPGWPRPSASCAALGKGDPSVALVTAMTLFTHAAQARYGGWPDARLRERCSPTPPTGPALVNALRVEPELGTPARGGVPATVAPPAG